MRMPGQNLTFGSTSEKLVNSGRFAVEQLGKIPQRACCATLGAALSHRRKK
jgi:hypothetical protein